MTKEPDAPPPAPRRRPAARRALRADGGRLRDHLRLDARVPLRARHDLHHRRLFVLLHDRARPRAVVARGGARRLCRRRVRRRARPLRLPPDPTRRGLILYGVRRLVRHWRGGRESRHHFLRRELRVDLDAADARERYRRRHRHLVARHCFDAGRASAVRLSQLVPRAHRRRRRAARALGEPPTGARVRPQPPKTLPISLPDRLPACLTWFLARTDVGVALRALSENPELVRGFGLNPRKLSQYAFAIGSLLVVPAALVATCVTGLTPTAGHRVVLISIAASIIGGIGSLRGAGLGGLILGLAESLAVWKLSTGWSEAVAFVILFGFILARPSGLFGTRARV